MSDYKYYCLRKEHNDIRAKLKQRDKYAELGRLALTTRAMICSHKDFMERGANQCEKHCTNHLYCQKRAELLAGEK